MSIEGLLAEHGSPLWLADLDRVRECWAGFEAAWNAVWDDVWIAYSYKTNRLPAIVRTLAAAGAGHEVVCAAEYALARDAFGAAGPDVVVNGPAKPEALLRRAGEDGALVVVDSVGELAATRDAGVHRVGLRVALEGVGVGPTRFGIARAEIPAAVARARGAGLDVEALHAHLVSTGFDRPLEGAARLGEAITVRWPPAPGRHAEAAARLGALAVANAIGTVDLGGGHPAAPAAAGAAAEVASALRATGFAGRVVLEPGRAIVADAVDLACTVAAIKTLADGTRCVVADAGTNLVPGALWGWPRIEAVRDGPASPALVAGPLCLNVDVLHPSAALPDLAPGDALVVRDVGAYQQAQSTRFGDLRPAVVAREDGDWRLCARRETLGDLLAGDLGAALVATGAGAHEEEEQ
jgi:diaminopimelate decarboxylase